MAAIVGEDCRNCLQDFARVSPGYHQTEEAGAGQGSNGLACWVIWACAPHRGLQQQLKKRLWEKEFTEQIIQKIVQTKAH